MKKAIMFGGGNIGRGFIGALFSNSGYEVAFVDVVDDVINALNREHAYPIRIIKGDVFEDIDVKKAGPRNFDITITLAKNADVANCLNILFQKMTNML